VVQAVRAGRSLTAELASVTPELRPGVQALTFQVMRQLGRAMALRERLASKAPPPAADALLCTALALSWQGNDAPYSVHTLVNQAVEAARQQRQTQAQSGFINGCLRRFLREREALVAETDSDPQARWNHPRWWVTRVQDEYPEDWQKLLDMAQQPAPMSLRVDTRHHSVAEYQAQLLAIGLAAQAVGASGLQLERAVPVQQLPGFSRGHVSVQDAAAQVAAPLLLQGRETGQAWRILDACAAPGGKTGHLLACYPNAQVLALDVDAERCQRIAENLQAWVYKMRPAPKCASPMPPTLRSGGTAWLSRRSCWMRPAPPQALCAGTPTCAGYAALATAHNWPKRSHNCSTPCGPCLPRVVVCCIALARFFVQRETTPCKRFFSATPMHECCPHPDI
jgi:16S rRNA (cytosine967-C5)-methyltransferase